jgi:hypothetical protein
MIKLKSLKLFTNSISPVFSVGREWGWVVFILFICFFTRCQAFSYRQDQYHNLSQKILHLHDLKSERNNLLENTRLKLRSMNDPDMIKMLLIKRLGLVAEGQTKVIFEESDAL